MIFPINETILFILHIMLAIVLLKLAVIASGVAYAKIKTYVLVHFRFSQSGFEPVATPNVTVKIKGKGKGKAKAKGITLRKRYPTIRE